MASRDEHAAAAQYASSVIGELQELLSAATVKAEEALGAVAEATGGTSVESGRNAMEFTASLRERIDEVFRITENVNAELQRYISGF